MKKSLLMIIAGAFLTITINAQTARFGFKAGVNANTFYLQSEGTGGSDTRYALTSPGFHIGGVADLGFSENFSIQPQLLFVTKGGRIQISGTETDFDFMNIDLPINLLYNNNGFFVGGGPNLSYSVSGKGQSGTDPKIDLFDEDALGEGTSFKRFGIGVNGVMGFRFPGGFMLSTNFTSDLNDLLKEDDATTGTIKAKNTFWGFSIGYMFGGPAPKKK